MNVTFRHYQALRSFSYLQLCADEQQLLLRGHQLVVQQGALPLKPAVYRYCSNYQKVALVKGPKEPTYLLRSAVSTLERSLMLP